MNTFVSSSGKDINDIISNALACLDVLNKLAKENIEKENMRHENTLNELECIYEDSVNTQDELTELQDYFNQ